MDAKMIECPRCDSVNTVFENVIDNWPTPKSPVTLYYIFMCLDCGLKASAKSERILMHFIEDTYLEKVRS
jgi:hypothetical protein